MTLSTRGLFAKLSTTDTQQNSFLSHYAESRHAVCHVFYCYAECRYAECHYAECHYAECHYAESRFAGCRYAECCYAECHYAECRGVAQGILFWLKKIVSEVFFFFFETRIFWIVLLSPVSYIIKLFCL
jgi:hypothetical protein